MNYVGFFKQKSLHSFKTILVNNFKTAFGLVSHVANRILRYKVTQLLLNNHSTLSATFIYFFLTFPENYLSTLEKHHQNIIWRPDVVDIADFL